MKRKGCGLLIFFLLLLATACGASKEEDIVMKINDRAITRSEYMVYLYTATQNFVATAGEGVWEMDFDGQTAEKLLEERTISTLQSVIAAEDYAAANQISLTEEEKAQAREAAEVFIANISEADLKKIGVDVESLTPLMESSYLYTLVHQEIAAACEVDVSDLEEYYLENREQLQKDYTVLHTKSILLSDAETANTVVGKAKAGEDFDLLFEKYDKQPDVENEEKVFLYQLREIVESADVVEQGDVFGPIQNGNDYFVLKIEDKKVPSEESVKEMAEEQYCSEIQTAYAEARFSEMIKSQKVEKIPEKWETLEKFHE